MTVSRRKRALATGGLLVLLVAATVSSFFFVRGGERELVIGEDDLAVPGGTPAGTSYLPSAPRDDLRELWSTRLEGELAGSPVVAGGRVFLCCRNGYLYCLEAEAGHPVWRYDAGEEFTTGPSACPHGVLAGTVTGKLLCLSGEGKLRWKTEVGGEIPSTPIPDAGRVYFGSRDGYLYCLDAEDGSRKWSFQAGGPVEVCPSISEGQVFCADSAGNLFALDALDGRLNWTARDLGRAVTSPAVEEKRVFLASELEVHCLDAQSGMVLWKFAVGFSPFSNLAVRGRQVLVLQGGEGRQCTAFSLDARTGDLLWQGAAGSIPEPTRLYATNQDLYFAGTDQLRAMAVESGLPSMQRDMEGILPASLLVSSKRILVGTELRKVYCLGE